METRRLHLLAELARLGSMRAVANCMGITTSTVSQQLTVLAREMGTALIEPDGRRVRLTPAGRRLAAHATGILAAVENARLDLAPGAEPYGTLRVAGFASAIRAHLLPLVSELNVSHPQMHVLIREHEPLEALELLIADEVDLALTYDYNLAPSCLAPVLQASKLWTAEWCLGVPAHHDLTRAIDAVHMFLHFCERDWIVNSRNSADETVIRTLASMAGFIPHITHQADSLDLVQGMIVARLGIGLLPVGTTVLPGVALIPLSEPPVLLRAYAVTRQGRLGWPPLRLVTDLLTTRVKADPRAPISPPSPGQNFSPPASPRLGMA